MSPNRFSDNFGFTHVRKLKLSTVFFPNKSFNFKVPFETTESTTVELSFRASKSWTTVLKDQRFMHCPELEIAQFD